MYIPKYSLVEDAELIKKFILDHSFGSLISGNLDELDVNHYPFLFKEKNDQVILYTHLAKSNSQWQKLEGNTCKIVFTGPHGYISPSFYSSKLNVPTWNYTAVHLTCQAKIISDSSLAGQLMRDLVSFHELRNKTNWDYSLPDDFHQRLLDSIVWIMFEVVKIEAKFKLSQNRSSEDYLALVKNLAQSHDEKTQDLLRLMTKVNSTKN